MMTMNNTQEIMSCSKRYYGKKTKKAKKVVNITMKITKKDHIKDS